MAAVSPMGTTVVAFTFNARWDQPSEAIALAADLCRTHATYQKIEARRALNESAIDSKYKYEKVSSHTDQMVVNDVGVIVKKDAAVEYAGFRAGVFASNIARERKAHLRMVICETDEGFVSMSVQDNDGTIVVAGHHRLQQYITEMDCGSTSLRCTSKGTAGSVYIDGTVPKGVLAAQYGAMRGAADFVSIVDRETKTKMRSPSGRQWSVAITGHEASGTEIYRQALDDLKAADVPTRALAAAIDKRCVKFIGGAAANFEKTGVILVGFDVNHDPLVFHWSLDVKESFRRKRIILRRGDENVDDKKDAVVDPDLARVTSGRLIVTGEEAKSAVEQQFANKFPANGEFASADVVDDLLTAAFLAAHENHPFTSAAYARIIARPEKDHNTGKKQFG